MYYIVDITYKIKYNIATFNPNRTPHEETLWSQPHLL